MPKRTSLRGGMRTPSRKAASRTIETEPDPPAEPLTPGWTAGSKDLFKMPLSMSPLRTRPNTRRSSMYQRVPQKSLLIIASPVQEEIQERRTKSKPLSPAMTRARRASTYQRKQSPAKQARNAATLLPPNTRTTRVKSPKTQVSSKIPRKPKEKSTLARSKSPVKTNPATKKRRSSETTKDPLSEKKAKSGHSKGTPRTKSSSRGKVAPTKKAGKPVIAPSLVVQGTAVMLNPITPASTTVLAKEKSPDVFTKIRDTTPKTVSTHVLAQEEPVSLLKKSGSSEKKKKKKRTPGRKGGSPVQKSLPVTETGISTKSPSPKKVSALHAKKSTQGREVLTPVRKDTSERKAKPAIKKLTPGRKVQLVNNVDSQSQNKSVLQELKKMPARNIIINIKSPVTFSASSEKTPRSAKTPKRKLTPGRVVTPLMNKKEGKSTKKIRTTPSRVVEHQVSSTRTKTPLKAARILGKTPLPLPTTRRTKTTPHTTSTPIESSARKRSASANILLSEIRETKKTRFSKLDENVGDEIASGLVVPEKSWSIWSWCTIL